MTKVIAPRGSARVLGLLLIMACTHATVTYTFFIARRLYVFGSSIYDLGTFQQALWNFMETGVPWYSMGPPDFEPYNGFGFHFQPIILVLAPIYHLLPYAETLNAFQSLAYASAVYPIFVACRALGAQPFHACVWALLLLLNPFVLSGATFDFQPICFAMPLMAWLLYCVIANRFVWLCVVCTLLVCTKEHYGLAVAGTGVLWALWHRDWWRGMLLATAGLAAFVAIVGFVMPALNPNGVLVMLQDAGRFAWLNAPLREFTGLLVRYLLPQTLLYVVLLLLPFALLPPVRGCVLLLPGIADLAVNASDLSGMQSSVLAYHSAPLLPLITIASCYGTLRLTRSPRKVVLTAAVCSMMFFYMLSPFSFPGAARLSNSYYHDRVWHFTAPEGLRSIQSQVTNDERLSVQTNVGPFFARRVYLRPFPARLDVADTVILYLDYPYHDFGLRPLKNPFAGEDYIRDVQELLSREEFGVVIWRAPWLVLRRGAEDIPGAEEEIRARLEWMRARYSQR